MLFSSTVNNCVEEQKQKLVYDSIKRWISLDDLFDYADVDQSGGVTKREMKDLLDQIRLSSSVDFDAIWDALDEDKSGEVTREEWYNCFSGIVPSSDNTSQAITWNVKPSYRDDVP